jgi:hypothetical protein
MIRALMWKEYREHRAIWLTLAVVSGAGLFGLSQLMAPEGILGRSGARESLQTVAVLFAWTYGLVCGAMLLANEYESGTMTFLDILPVRRLQLWLVKCSFGLLLLLTQVVVLGSFVIGLGITETAEQLWATLLAMLIFGLIALSWSLLFSALGKNVLNVIGFSLVGQIAGCFVALALLFPVSIMLGTLIGWDLIHPDKARFLLACLGVLGLIALPIFGSARLFTRLDRQRARSAEWLSRRQVDTKMWASWGRLLWLSYLQMRRLLIGLTIFSLVLGFVLPLFGPAAWPALTLFLGVLCGVTVWSDEQLSAAYRFLGDQRLPLGRVWIVKVGMRFALAVFAAFLLLLPSLILAVIHQVEAHAYADRMLFSPPKHVPFFADLFRSSLVGPVVPVWAHVSMWLLYGFTAGHLCGLLFRKSLVAVVVALSSAGMLLSFWVPSLVGIGLHFWQVAGVPIALLVGGWLLMPAWTADRLLARGTFVRLGAVLLAAALWTAGGFWYRVAEIPDLPDAFNLPEFAASIPTMDQNKNRAGMEMHAAWHEVELMTHELFFRNEPIRRPLFANSNSFQMEMSNVCSEGWPDRPSDLGDRLDAWFQKEWYGHLAKVADLPLGVADDPRLLSMNGRRGRWELLTYLNEVLAVRGLQMQARGDHRVFVDNLRISLALSRNVQNHAPPHLVRAGRQAELACVQFLDRWLEKLPGHPELLERVRDILLEHEALLPSELDVLRTAYLIAQLKLEGSPETLVEEEVNTANDRWHSAPELQRNEMELVSLLWRIPWEHERHQRILRVVFEGSKWQKGQARMWGGKTMSSLDREAVKAQPRSKRTTASLIAAKLKVAVRLYQAKTGKLPDRLVELGALVVRGGRGQLNEPFRSAIPLDPFDNQPFRYRVQRGKDGRSEAVLWSVGEDEIDDGGKKPGNHEHATSPGEDLVYPVPPTPR